MCPSVIELNVFRSLAAPASGRHELCPAFAHYLSRCQLDLLCAVDPPSGERAGAGAVTTRAAVTEATNAGRPRRRSARLARVDGGREAPSRRRSAPPEACSDLGPRGAARRACAAP